MNGEDDLSPTGGAPRYMMPTQERVPEPGSFWFGGIGDALTNEDISVLQAAHGPSTDERERVGFPNFTDPAGGYRVWARPETSLISPSTAEDISDAREIASNLGGGMTAEPGAPLFGDRPIIRNPDGSMSTERNIGVQDDRLNAGRYTNIPSIQEGQQLSFRQAIEYALRSGRQYPSFDTPEEGDAAIEARHQILEDPNVTPQQLMQAGALQLAPIRSELNRMTDELTTRLMWAMLGRGQP